MKTTMNTNNETTTSSQKKTGRQALVIGGSIAGLFAARVLADYFDMVTIVDRDVFPLTPEHRKGVPQSHHGHGLLATAYPLVEQLFPGIMNDLRADDAAIGSNMVPLAIVSPKGLLPLPKYPGEIITFSRPLLEWHVRDRVTQRPEVQIIANTEVTGLLATPDRTRIIGVQTRERGVIFGTQSQHDCVVAFRVGDRWRHHRRRRIGLRCVPVRRRVPPD